jgi:DNA-binding MarR family transcriptional regulator
MNQPDTGDSTRSAEASAAAAESLTFSLLTAAHALEDRIESSLAGVGLSMAKLGVLNLLAEAGAPLTLSELASLQKCVRSNMTQLVDRLEADGLVQRIDDPHDRRSVRAALTPLGEERQIAGAARMQTVQREFAAVLPREDRAMLERILTAVR